jgi:hypothetical protein
MLGYNLEQAKSKLNSGNICNYSFSPVYFNILSPIQNKEFRAECRHLPLCSQATDIGAYSEPVEFCLRFDIIASLRLYNLRCLFSRCFPFSFLYSSLRRVCYIPCPSHRFAFIRPNTNRQSKARIELT